MTWSAQRAGLGLARLGKCSAEKERDAAAAAQKSKVTHRALPSFPSSATSPAAAMKASSFQLSNVLGSVYQRGPLAFSPDGRVLVSPTGNRVSLVELHSQRSRTLPMQTRKPIALVALCPPRPHIALVVDVDGRAQLLNINAGATLAPTPCTVITAPCPTLTRPVPRNRHATSPGTATLCNPAPMPSSAWTGHTPQCSMKLPASAPRSGSAANEISSTSQ